MIQFITYLILAFGSLNLIRLGIFMVAADLYDIKRHKHIKENNRKNSSKKNPIINNPKVSILIPAYNEELTLKRTVLSVFELDYENKEVIIIDDGSKDKTFKIASRLAKTISGIQNHTKAISQKNAGKGSALNAGIKAASGDLIMVLDADAALDKDAVSNSIKYFEDSKVIAIASSVRVEEDGTILGLVQKAEYMIANRMKRALTTLNIEYIIGGVGSIYRREVIEKLGGYMTDTITEDIELSMRSISEDNINNRLVYAYDVRSKTQAVPNLSDLIKQRYRWKFGRIQSFLKFRSMFFSSSKTHSKLISWYQLPYAIIGEINLIFEPIFLGAIVGVAFLFGDFSGLLLAGLIMCTFIAVNILASKDIEWRAKLKMAYLTPLIYILLPILSLVELAALIKSVLNFKQALPGAHADGSWDHVERQAV